MTVTPAQHLWWECACARSKHWWGHVMDLPSQSTTVSFNSAAEEQKPKSEATYASRRDTLMIPQLCARSLPQRAAARLLLTSVSVRPFKPKCDLHFQEQEILVCKCVSTAIGDNEENLLKKPLNNVVCNRIRFSLGWTYFKLSECDHFSGVRCTAKSPVRLFLV